MQRVLARSAVKCRGPATGAGSTASSAMTRSLARIAVSAGLNAATIDGQTLRLDPTGIFVMSIVVDMHGF